MGQKTNPIGFRLGVTRDHRSKWYANRDFPALLKEDELLRKYLHARLGHAAISDLTIERKPGKVVVTVLARDHVFITRFSFRSFIARTFFCSASRTYGPFFTLLAMLSSRKD